MTSRVAKPAARWIGVLWLALAIAGWFDSPVVGRHGFIGADQPMSLAHAVLGLYLLATSFSGESSCAIALYTAAAACVSFAAYAVFQLGQYDGVLLFNTTFASASNEYLHLALGFTMAALGKFNTSSKQLLRE